MDNKIFTDTSDFYSIVTGDIIDVGSHQYKVIGNSKELRFGIEDPKFWVKRVVDLNSSQRKIIKLTFLESFKTYLGGIKIKCFRSPLKESKVLEIVKGHPNFMQGETFFDTSKNNIRVLDVIRGKSFLYFIDSFKMKYDLYFKSVLPEVLKKLIRAFEGIHFLHTKGLKHGDIRNDHIIVEKKTSNFVWIDFDYDFQATENPLGMDIYGLGNILAYAVGKGFHNSYMIENDKYTYSDLADRICLEDFSLLDRRRFMNLRKIYPVIPKSLNNILMHFSLGADVYYEHVDEIIEDLNRTLTLFD